MTTFLIAFLSAFGGAVFGSIAVFIMAALIVGGNDDETTHY